MAKTMTNEGLNLPHVHSVKTERGFYLMGPSWIDCTAPRDMMDYDWTASFAELRDQHEKLRLMNIALCA